MLKNRKQYLFSRTKNKGIIFIFLLLYGCATTKKMINTLDGIQKEKIIVLESYDSTSVNNVRVVSYDKLGRVKEQYSGGIIETLWLNLDERYIYTDTVLEKQMFFDGKYEFSLIYVTNIHSLSKVEVYDSLGFYGDTNTYFTLDKSLNVLTSSSWRNLSHPDEYWNYSSGGKLIEYGKFDNGSKDKFNEWKYNQNGCLIKKIQYRNDYPYIIKYKVDEKCNIIKYTGIDKEGHVGDKLRYGYEFDAVGNWVKKIEINALTNDTMKIEAREIEYYK